MRSNGRPLVPYLRQSRARERTISIEEQRRDIRPDSGGVMSVYLMRFSAPQAAP